MAAVTQEHVWGIEEMTMTGKALEGQPVPVSPCPQHMPHGLAWDKPRP
jgi:hypothetical protein